MKAVKEERRRGGEGDKLVFCVGVLKDEGEQQQQEVKMNLSRRGKIKGRTCSCSFLSLFSLWIHSFCFLSFAPYFPLLAFVLSISSMLLSLFFVVVAHVQASADRPRMNTHTHTHTHSQRIDVGNSPSIKFNV
jgi:hypothetical protein